MNRDLNVVGAGYTAALFSGDARMLADYKQAFTEAELIEALERTLRVLGRRVARESKRTLPEVGDAMFAAAKAFQHISEG